VALLCASRGELGIPAGPNREALARARVNELRDAAATLGVRELSVLDHPDGALRWARVTEFHADIVFAIRRHRPAAVVTFGDDGLYWHGDHIAVHERTLTAVRSFGAEAPPLYFVTMPPGAMRAIADAAARQGWTPPAHGFWSLVPDAFGLHAQPPTFRLDVADWVDRKLAALGCHRTQMGAGNPFDCLAPADARRWLGTEHFQRAPGIGPAAPVLERLV
jgi:LmbE family N-acetylglucosaminyl deacetylase